MKASGITGLGNPEPIGKKSLFQPPKTEKPSKLETIPDKRPESRKVPAPKKDHSSPQRKKSPKRVRTTIDLTTGALKVIQGIQLRYRLNTGKVLPLWKAVSNAIEYYGQSARKGKHG